MQLDSLTCDIGNQQAKIQSLHCMIISLTLFTRTGNAKGLFLGAIMLILSLQLVFKWFADIDLHRKSLEIVISSVTLVLPVINKSMFCSLTDASAIRI